MLTPWFVTRPAVLQGRHMGSVGVSWIVMLQETQKLSAVSKGQVVNSLFVPFCTNCFVHSLKGAIRNTVFEWQFRVPSSGGNGDAQRIPTGIHPSGMLKCSKSYNFVQLIKPYMFSSNKNPRYPALMVIFCVSASWDPKTSRCKQRSSDEFIICGIFYKLIYSQPRAIRNRVCEWQFRVPS